jgi:hypothetical protein
VSGWPGFCDVVDLDTRLRCGVRAEAAARMENARIIGCCWLHAACLALYGVPVFSIPDRRPHRTEPGS